MAQYMSRLPVRRQSIWHEPKRSDTAFGKPSSDLLSRLRHLDGASDSETDFAAVNDGDFHNRVSINVGGHIFQTFDETLKMVPNTRLAGLDHSSEFYDIIEDEYFFDRNPILFECVLDYYRFGEMHIPKYICAASVRMELEYWNLNENCLTQCCRKQFHDDADEIATCEILQEEFNQYNLPPKDEDDLCNSVCSKWTFGQRWSSWRRKAWEVIDNPQSSPVAKIWAVVYYCLIVVSILSFFIGTLPSCRVSSSSQDSLLHIYMDSENTQSSAVVNNCSSSSKKENTPTASAHSTYASDQLLKNSKVKLLLTTQPHDSVLTIDFLCMLFFTSAFVVQLALCPSRLGLFKRLSTFMDLIYLLPIWTLFILEVVDPAFWKDAHRLPGLLALQALMVMRVFRIFRLARFYRGLRVLLLSIKATLGELLLLFVFVGFAMTLYGSLIYCAEIFVEDSFESVFIGVWWSLITMTTVGYGDYYPQTWAGYIIGCFCALTGIILIGMPVPIIASNFHAYYGFRHSSNETALNDRPRRVQKKRKSKQLEKNVKICVTSSESIADDQTQPEQSTSLKGESPRPSNKISPIVTLTKTKLKMQKKFRR